MYVITGQTVMSLDRQWVTVTGQTVTSLDRLCCHVETCYNTRLHDASKSSS